MRTIFWSRQIKILPGKNKLPLKRLRKFDGELRGLYLTRKGAEGDGADWTEDTYEDGTTWIETAVRVKVKVL